MHLQWAYYIGVALEGMWSFLLEKIVVSPIVWKSKTLWCVVRSTLSAEASAVIDALDLSYFTSQVLSEILDYKYQSWLK